MTNQEVIQRLRSVQEALDENNADRVATEIESLMNALNAAVTAEERRHKAAVEIGYQDDSNQSNEEADSHPEREYSAQNVRVTAYRDQIFLALIEYLSMDEPAAEVADMLSDRIDELIGAEEDLHTQETEFGGRLDAQYEERALLTIGNVTQKEIITMDERNSEFTITLRNTGGRPGEGTVVVTGSDNLIIETHAHSTGSVSPGEHNNVTVSFEIEDILIEEIAVFLVDADANELAALNPSEARDYALSNAVDSYYHQVEIDIPEEKRSPPVIERTLVHSFTDPRERKDYVTITGTAAGGFSLAGYAAYRKFFAEDTPTNPSDPEAATGPDPEADSDSKDENETTDPNDS